jgi:asparagine N-glycosylation enzyme membrane subunit Stt3
MRQLPGVLFVVALIASCLVGVVYVSWLGARVLFFVFLVCAALLLLGATFRKWSVEER